MGRVPPNMKRINFDIPEETWEKMRHLQYGRRSDMLRALMDRICRDANLPGHSAETVFMRIINGEFRIQYGVLGEVEGRE